MTILSVGAHMDDSEYGIGGILIQAVGKGHRVVCVVATGDYRSWGSTVGREEACKQQQMELADAFGYEKVFLDHKYHQVEADVAFKKEIANIYIDIKPEITFVHNTSDHWPDHVACGVATKDAVLFSHGLTGDLSQQRCPRIFAYNLTPHQTISFSPDTFVDVSDVMSRYMALLRGTDSCLSGKEPGSLVRYEVKDVQAKETMQLTAHGWARLNQCAQWADATKNGKYAIGLETLWGPRETELW